MTEINLLPWRSVKLNQLKMQLKLYFLTSMCVASSITVSIDYFVTKLTHHQELKYQQLDHEIKELNQKIKATDKGEK